MRSGCTCANEMLPDGAACNACHGLECERYCRFRDSEWHRRWNDCSWISPYTQVPNAALQSPRPGVTREHCHDATT